MGLDSVGAEVYYIHGLTVSQRTPGFLGVTNLYVKLVVTTSLYIIR